MGDLSEMLRSSLLLEALRPFARVAEIIRPDLPDSTEIELRIGGKRIYGLALGSLREARKAIRTALQPKGPDHG